MKTLFCILLTLLACACHCDTAPSVTTSVTIQQPGSLATCVLTPSGATWTDEHGKPWLTLSNAGGIPMLQLMQGAASVLVVIGPAGPELTLIGDNGAGWTWGPGSYQIVAPIPVEAGKGVKR